MSDPRIHTFVPTLEQKINSHESYVKFYINHLKKRPDDIYAKKLLFLSLYSLIHYRKQKLIRDYGN